MHDVPKYHPARSYMQAVLHGEIPACKTIIQAVERACRDHATGRERGLVYVPEDAHYVLDYGRLCKHSKGKWAGQPFEHAPWQRFITSELFGWKWEGSGLRRFKMAYIEVPKKNGKSTYMAVLGIYMLHGDEENGCEVYALATQRDQARICFDEARRMVRASEDLRQEIEVYAHNMHILRTNSLFEPLASDVDTVDGRNPHFQIVDELHRHKSRFLWDLIENTSGAREQPMVCSITTAGWDTTSVCYEQHKYALGILEGLHQNDLHFAYVAMPDEGDDWHDERTWRKVNPNLGHSLDIGRMRQMYKKACSVPALQNAFRRYQLDEWTEQADRWLSMDDWAACPTTFDYGGLEGQVCWGGIDLAMALDMSAFVLLFEVDDWWVVLPRFYVPEDTVSKRVHQDKLPYDTWVEQGLLTATPGNVTDFNYIRSDILEATERYQIKSLGYDPYKATHLALQLQDDGLPMVEVRQGPPSLSEPMQKLEAKVIAHELCHGANPILTWNAGNIVVRANVNGDIAPDKGKSQEKIDGMVALIIAINRKIATDIQTKPSIYATQAPLIISV